MSDSALVLLFKYVLILSLTVGFFSFVIFIYGCFRYWFIRDTKRNVILAFLLGPFAFNSFDVSIERKRKFNRFFRIACIFLAVSLLMLLACVIALYLV